MRSRAAVRLLAVAIGALAVLAGVRAHVAADTFPHERHSRLFPTCEGCHAGIVAGDRARSFPTPDDCARCHDGTRVRRVTWTPPGPRPTNLHFSHPAHFERTRVSGDSVTCRTCHLTEGGTQRLSVGDPRPALCISCHAHRAPVHLAADAQCSRCHQPLTQATSLSVERVASLPRPAWHDDPDWGSNHGRGPLARAATCATCHARESCERCHANATRVPAIQALGRDTRIAELVRGRAASYPLPSSHRSQDWAASHGPSARTSATVCANCHTRPSCQACHRDGAGSAQVAIAALPMPGRAPGVSVQRVSAAIHPSDFRSRHGTLAASGGLQCAQCHAQEFCSGCHAGADSRAFHPDNFVERHARDVFTASAECTSCHDPERFCRACHSRAGVASAGMKAAFHTGEPNWVLSHGTAARSGLEACASCHRQADCTRCHSATGGWGVNPHAPGFQADRLAARNAATCRVCHAGDTGGTP